MIKIKHLAFVVGLFMLLLPGCTSRRVVRAPSSTARDPGVVAGWAELTDRALQALWQLRPWHAVALGVQRGTPAAPKRRGQALKTHVDQLTELVQELYAVEPKDLGPAERIDRELLIGLLRLELHELAVEARPVVVATTPLDEAEEVLLALWLNPARPLEERVASVAEILIQLPEQLTIARDNLHRPIGILCRAAMDRSAALSDFIEHEVRAAGPSLSRDVHERLALGVDEALHGLQAYRAGLEPLCGTGPEIAPIGVESYHRRLRYQHGHGGGHEQVIALGLEWLERAQRSLAELAAPSPTIVQAPASFSQRAFLDTLATQVSALRALTTEKALATLPYAAVDARAVPTPKLLLPLRPTVSLWIAPPIGPAESVLLVGAFPDAVDQRTRDELYTRLTDGSWLLASARETFPGRQLQRLHAQRHPSLVRRAHRSSALEDGWALYALGLALDHGLVLRDEAAQRGYWLAIEAAAARAVVDARLNVGLIDAKQAVAFLQSNAGGAGALTGASAEQQVLSMLRAPTMAAAALLGVTAIESMRARAQRARGTDFSLRRFHDLLLAQGSIPPTYVEHALFGEPLPQHDAPPPPQEPEPPAAEE